MLIVQNLTYIHPNRDPLFSHINFTIADHDKVALIGNNGSGKSTVLKIITGELYPSAGSVKTGAVPYYVPQVFGQYNYLTIAEALKVAGKMHALKEILAGNTTETNLTVLNDDWTIEERCNEALYQWQLKDLDLTQKMETLSGGQKTKVFLAGIHIHQSPFVLLDEPSNHLDTPGRELLYNFIRETSATLIIVSHDRKLLNLLDLVYVLSKRGITVYGGNYDFYADQKLIEDNALDQDIKSKEKSLRKAKEKERDSMERQNKLDARGKKKQEKAGVPTIMMNTLRNNAEKSTARIKDVHAEKKGLISKELDQLRKELPGIDKMRFCFDNAALHKGKTLFTATNINFSYAGELLWQHNLHIHITSGERIALKGLNGAGKTTLIKIILGRLAPSTGTVYRAAGSCVYIDQDYSLINDRFSVYEQAAQFNTTGLLEHEIKIRLTRFLFAKEDWDKPCADLSGGERMRLMLCCLTISNKAPDMIILDEPTNNLDIQNIAILTAAINEYEATLIAVSHDITFLEEVNVKLAIEL